ncbi:unnamed protein product [Rotaria sordida]|uniref:Voltage-gated hydrogen channel 1 n=1 Tax=Rotaria sordida TaxID=392033 RepID=A0A814EYR7_9BILA|nr:unnamed protein product [Rotaria sordida]CAF0975691.1 unnamed protein product [Rotaria sordida]CAF0976340.1 unnamed protein product [Rotaria sordida]
MEVEHTDVVVTPVLSEDGPRNLTEQPESYENKSVSIDMKISNWNKVKAANRRILPRKSNGEVKLSNIIDELKKMAIEEQEAQKNEQTLGNNSLNSIKLFRKRLANFLQKATFHYIIILLVITDLIVVVVDLVLAQLSSPCLTDEEMEFYNTTVQRDTCLLEHSVHLARTDLFLFYFSALLLTIFVLEIFISLYAFGWKYCTNPLYLLDSIIVLASFIMEMYFHYGNIARAGRAAAAFLILRLWKIIRAIHAVAHSIRLKNRVLINKIQEARILLEEEKQQTEQTLEKQEIKIEYFIKILTNLGKLPSTSRIDDYVNNIWTQRKQNNVNMLKN